MPSQMFVGQAGAAQGNFGTTVVNSGASNRRFSFLVPSDVSRIAAFECHLIATQAGAVGAAQDLDFTMSYAKAPPGGAVSTISDLTSTYTINALNEITVIDLTTFFGTGPGLDNSAALQMCGIRLHNNTAGRVEVLGFVLQYS